MSAHDLDPDITFARPLDAEEASPSPCQQGASSHDEGTLVVPVPADGPKPSFRHRVHGEPTKPWAYNDARGQLLGYICRFDQSGGGKEILPYTCWRDRAGQLEWRRKWWPEPRPLYGLDQLAARPDALVIVTEGEKAADAAALIFPDAVAITSPSGACAANKADWSPLRGRKVLIAPDANDAPNPQGRIPGEVYAQDVAAQALRHGAAEVLVLDTAALSRLLPDGSTREGPAGWDLADALGEGWDPQVLRREAETLIEPWRRSEQGDEPDPSEGAAGAHYISYGTFTMDPVWGLSAEIPRRGQLQTVHVSGPFEVLGRVRAPNGMQWARLLRWRDDDGRIHTHAVPDADLHGDAKALAGALASKGLRITTGVGPGLIAAYLNGVTCDTRVTQVERTGWHEIQGEFSFVLPEHSIGGAANETVILSKQGPTPYESHGSLSDWQAGIGHLSIGHSRLMLAISTALAGTLLMVVKLDGGGVHYYGASSIGKSTLIEAAASVWGRGSTPGFLRTWRSTANALEAAAAIHTDTVLVLDELGVVEAKEAGAAAYQLANGTGKGRSARDGSLRSPLTWRTTVLSTGEIRLADKLRENQQRAMAGQAVRIIDVPADAGRGFGVFDHPGEAGDAKELADAIKLAARTHYGMAGPAFVERLIEQGLEVVEDAVRSSIAKFRSDVLPAGADGQVQRAADRFGLIAAAGELARELGILPWAEGAAYNAAAVCFRAWTSERGGTEPAEVEEAIARVRRFIEQHGQSRFEQASKDVDEREVRITNRAGYRHGSGEGEQWWVLPETWKTEVCAGLDATRTARVLADRGMLEKGKDGFATVKKVLGRATRVYVLTAKILEGGEVE